MALFLDDGEEVLIGDSVELGWFFVGVGAGAFVDCKEKRGGVRVILGLFLDLFFKNHGVVFSIFEQKN